MVPPRDSDEIRRSLEELLHDAEWRASLGARASAAARERFGESLMVERMLRVFSEAAKKNG
jgi:hypothetical protein